MRNLFFFVLVFFLFKPEIKCQSNYGLKIGYSYSFVKQTTNRYDDFDDFLIYQVTLENIRPLPSLGVTYMYAVPETVYLQADLMYRQISTNYSVESELIGALETFPRTKTRRFIEIPISGGLLYEDFRFGAGTIFTVLIHETDAFQELFFFEEKRRTLETGAFANIGMLLNNVTIDFNVEYRFNSAADYIFHKGLQQGFDQHPFFLGLGIGVFLNRPR